MAIHEIKRNDTRPYFAVSLDFADGTDPQNMASVRFIARDESDTTIKIDAAAVITDVPSADVEYRFVAADTDTAGSFLCEWEVTFTDASIQTFPTRGYDRLKVIGDLA